MILEILVYPGLLFVFAASILYSGIFRKLAARMQHRIGPPLLQPLWDFIKLLGKEDIVPEQARAGYTLWPFLALSSAFTAALLVPVAGTVALSFTGDIILLIYFFSLASISLYLAGLASNNPFASIGSMRGLTQLIAYEFPLITSVVAVLFASQTLSPFLVNSFQLYYGWNLFLYPFASFAFIIAMLSSLELPPFHVPDAHQEIVAGYSTDYSGTRLAYLELTRMVKAFVMLSLAIALFFGGSSNIVVFLTKSILLILFLVLARVILSRLRIEQVLKICWLAGFIGLIDLLRVLV